MIQVYDDFLFYADKYLEQALAADFQSIEVAPGVTFHGIAKVGKSDWFAKALQATTTLPLKINHSFFRKSPGGQIEPNFIHTDADMGQYTAILYLNYVHPEDEGTKFWQNNQTKSCLGGSEHIPSNSQSFELIKVVPMRFNRAIIFDSRLYHSRANLENFGEGDGARLTQTIFFSL